jgi:hypothetical protein
MVPRGFAGNSTAFQILDALLFPLEDRFGFVRAVL